MLNGDTRIIAHVGYPTTTFKSPMIYNPWFERALNACVCRWALEPRFRPAFQEICRFTNFHGALITMPHKVAVIDLLDELSTAVKIAGACNAVRLSRRPADRRHVRRRGVRARRAPQGRRSRAGAR